MLQLIVTKGLNSLKVLVGSKTYIYHFGSEFDTLTWYNIAKYLRITRGDIATKNQIFLPLSKKESCAVNSYTGPLAAVKCRPYIFEPFKANIFKL